MNLVPIPSSIFAKFTGFLAEFHRKAQVCVLFCSGTLIIVQILTECLVNICTCKLRVTMFLSNRFRFLTTSLLLGLASVGTFQSCVSTKGLVYFQGTTERFSSDSIREVYTPTIQPNDRITSINQGSNPNSPW
jgi:hypothetical protein